MLNLIQVVAYASISMQVVYHTNACALRKVEHTLMYQQSKFNLAERILADYNSYMFVSNKLTSA